jgi:hypothetical protein
MGSSFFYACGVLAAMSPFLAIIGILGWHFIRRSVLGRNQPRAKRILGLWSSTVLLGMAFQFLQVIYQPSLSQVLAAQHDDLADEDDSGAPDTLAKQLSRQLRKIRRGERIDRIVLRLDDSPTEKAEP